MSYKKDLQIIKQYATELLNKYPNRDDEIAIKTEFNNIMDMLCKDNEISYKTYYNCYLCLDSYYPMIYCGSYKIRI